MRSSPGSHQLTVLADHDELQERTVPAPPHAGF